MGLKVSDLIPGKYYRIEFDRKELVFQHKDSTGTPSYPNDKDRPNTYFYVVQDLERTNGEFKRNNTPWISGRGCRPANALEILWLKDCIAKNIYLEKPQFLGFQPELIIGEKMDWYVNIVGLEDPADDRLMSNFTSDFEFIGFSRINGGPIFKLKENDQTEKYWYENVMSKINEIGGMVNIITALEDHVSPGSSVG